ncbi:hypothetical protein RB195_006013 [Necator americanus]|uniref:DRBM domain-containing protein n=1 Tax=Necator americanus TaxID=51031 RepID=A0ABR1BUD2_NECAM
MEGVVLCDFVKNSFDGASSPECTAIIGEWKSRSLAVQLWAREKIGIKRCNGKHRGAAARAHEASRKTKQFVIRLLENSENSNAERE